MPDIADIFAQPDTSGQSQPPPATPASKPPTKPPILTTSFAKVGGADQGDSIPWNPGDYPGSEQFPQAVKDLYTGDTSVSNPDIGPLRVSGLGLGGGPDAGFWSRFASNVTNPKALAITAESMLSRDPAALQRVIQERVPNAQFTKDDQGNVIVQVPGNPPMYLDRPGATAQKALFYAPQTAAAVLSRGQSIPALAALSAGQHALSNVGSYALGGAESAYDLIGTGLSGAFGAGAGLLGKGLLSGANWLFSQPATQTAEQIAANARALADHNFAGTKGTITGDPAQLAKENALATGGSDGAQVEMAKLNDFNAAQNDVNKRQIIGEVSGNVAPGTKMPDDYQANNAQFGDDLNQAVTDRVKALNDNANGAWAKLGPVSTDSPAGQSVTFSPAVSAKTLDTTGTIMRNAYGAPTGPNGTYLGGDAIGDGAPSVFKAYNRVRDMVTGDDGSTPAPFNLGHLQDGRQTFSNAVNATIKNNPQDAGIAINLRQAFDNAVAGAEINPGQLSGDPAALANFRAANAATRAKYAFTEPNGNPAAQRFIANVTNDAAPNTGEQSIQQVFGGGGGAVTPGGGTNGIVTHLQTHLGDDATQPLSGALALRTLYGGKGTTASVVDDPAPQFDYNATVARIQNQFGGNSDIPTTLLPPDAQKRLIDYAKALNVLGVANRPGGPTLNPPMTAAANEAIRELKSKVPFVGPAWKSASITAEAKDATQGGAEIMNRATEGATTARQLGVSIPRQTAPWLQNANPFYDWQRPAWQAGVPAYRGAGLLGAAALQQPTATVQQQPYAYPNQTPP